MEGVAPLAERPARVAGHRRQVSHKDRPRRSLEGRGGDPQKVPGFEIEHQGERIEGRSAGADPRQLLRLRSGAIPVDRRLDLHGLSQKAARETVESALAQAARAGARALLIIHGRGRHSPDGPVLKRALPFWLAAAPGNRVLGFTSADPARGGAGATLVLLRRRKRR